MVDQTTGNQSRAATILVESKICDGSVEHEFWHTGVANLAVVSSRLTEELSTLQVTIYTTDHVAMQPESGTVGDSQSHQL
jgi:hypothetical protein